jgi:hypothetical protein
LECAAAAKSVDMVSGDTRNDEDALHQTNSFRRSRLTVRRQFIERSNSITGEVQSSPERFQSPSLRCAARESRHVNLNAESAAVDISQYTRQLTKRTGVEEKRRK